MADAVLRLIPRTEQCSEWISRENHSLEMNNSRKSQEKNWIKGKGNGILMII